MFVLELEYSNHLSIASSPSSRDLEKINSILELQDYPTRFIEEPGLANVTGYCNRQLIILEIERNRITGIL